MSFYKLVQSALLFIATSDGLAQGYPTQMTVAQDGSGDFTSIQAAIDATKAFPDERITIYVKKGVYKEKVEIFSWNTQVSLIGEDPNETIITYDDHFKKLDKGRNSTFHTYTLKVSGNDFRMENLQIVNSSGLVGQAVALHVEADRVVIKNCIFKGWQDTMYLAGEGSRTYLEGCYIEGSTDFIFGEGTALFENCQIHSLADSYITAASTPQDAEFGFVFQDCQLTAADGVTNVYLGRPWRKYAKTVFMNCSLGSHIHPEGWQVWSNKDEPSTTFYAEYNNAGEGSGTSERVDWSGQLSDEEASAYTKENILRNWEP